MKTTDLQHCNNLDKFAIDWLADSMYFWLEEFVDMICDW